MVFCNLKGVNMDLKFKIVTILILIDGFLQLSEADFNISDNLVTILILIDGFLQSRLLKYLKNE